MTTAPAFPLEQQPEREPNDPKRRKYGRPLVLKPGAKPGDKLTAYTRCTTYAGTLDDTFKLGQWQQRMVALGLSARSDLLLAVAAHADDRDKLDELCDRAREAASATAAATTGTALHALTERLDRGLELGPMPADAERDVRAYERATSALTALYIERFLVNDDLKVGGTPDRVVEFQGRNYIADLKTGGIEYGALKIAMQLAMYAHSRLYDVATGRRTDLPDVDQERAIVIHLPAGTGECTLHWIDIRAGWGAIETARDVRSWRNRARSMLAPLNLPASEPESRDQAWSAPAGTNEPDLAGRPAGVDANGVIADDGLDELRNRVACAQTVDELTALWSTNQFRWTGELTQIAAARKQVLMGATA